MFIKLFVRLLTTLLNLILGVKFINRFKLNFISFDEDSLGFAAYYNGGDFHVDT